MAFVPYVPPRQASPRAEELGQRLTLAIAEFRQKYPDLSDEEIGQALLAAAGRSASGERRPAAALGAVFAAVVVAAGLGVYLFVGGSPGGSAPFRPVVIAIAVAAAVVALVVRRSRRE